MRDQQTIEQYGANIKGVQTVIPRLLKTFSKFNVRATFAAVGFLFFENKTELLNNLPTKRPKYKKANLSPYEGYFNTLGTDLTTDIYHFAPHLIRLIQKYPEQEIGTHTFSHYYCLEKGQDINEFKEDILNAQKIAKKFEIQLTSLVFPRNQFNEKYLKICKELGITCYRGNEHSWLYPARYEEKESLFRMGLRFIDTYINISGQNCYSDEYLKQKFPMDIPSSRFLRPFSAKLKLLDNLKLRRIKSGMTYAAQKGLTFHLWWHPHNFGINQDENFYFLEKILFHYQKLNKKYNFHSITMSDLAKKLKAGD